MAIVMCEECDRSIDLDEEKDIVDDGECFYHFQCAVDAGIKYTDWEDDIPIRRNKSAKPKMGMSGRSIKTVITRIIGKKGMK